MARAQWRRAGQAAGGQGAAIHVAEMRAQLCEVSCEDTDMVKATISVLVGFVIWFVAATLGNFLVRALIPTYVVAEAVMAFTLPMLLARLTVGFFSSLVAGFACSWVARQSRKPTYVLSVIMVVFFLPVHYNLLAKFPIWYHVAFLGTLAPLIILGGTLRGRLETKAVNAP
jgi:hypothetical protein